MPYERSKRALSPSAAIPEAAKDFEVEPPVDGPSGGSSTHQTAPQQQPHSSPSPLPPLPIGALPSKATLATAGPLFAAHAVQTVPKVLALVFVLPLLLVDATQLRPGLLHGALRANDPLTAAYLAYVASTVVLAPLTGAAADALAPPRRQWLCLALLTGVCGLLLALLLMLHQPATTLPWAAIVATLCAGVVVAEVTAPVLAAELASLLGPNASAIEAGMLSTQAALAGLGAAVVLVAVPALIASAATAKGHAADLPAARYASIGGFALSALCLLLYALTGAAVLAGEPQQERQPGAASTLLDALRAGSPTLPRLLLMRILYQAGLRSAGYLGLAYVVRHLQNHASIAATALTLALASAFLAALLAQGFLAAQAAQQRRRLQGRQAGRHVPAHVVFAASDGGATRPLTQAPLLVWLAVLAVAFAAVPSEMQLDPRTGGTELTPSREMGIVYILALIAGLGLGFLQAYERGVLCPLLWPRKGPTRAAGGTTSDNHNHNHNVGRVAGLLLASGASLEWAPTVLYAGLTKRGAAAPIAALVPCFALALLVAVLFFVCDRLGYILIPPCCLWHQPGDPEEGGGGEPAPPDGARPRLGASISFFLLRALPSHLSTIPESPAPSHLAPASPASPVSVSLEQSGDWTPRTA